MRKRMMDSRVIFNGNRKVIKKPLGKQRGFLFTLMVD